MEFSDAISRWRPLSDISADRLREARVQAHWAVQPVSAVGRTVARPEADDSHTSVSWRRDLSGFAGVRVPDGRCAAVALDTPRLVVLDPHAREIAGFELDGRALEEAERWLAERFGLDSFEPRDYELPERAIGEGAPFRFRDREALGELVAWYGNAELFLETVRRETPGASPVCCWPHHFDLATLIRLSGERTIGVGLSPGDDSYDEPYLYVSPSPDPAPGVRPPLAGGGIWHEEGWIGAVLPASRLARNEAGGAVAEFLTSGLDAVERSTP